MIPFRGAIEDVPLNIRGCDQFDAYFRAFDAGDRNVSKSEKRTATRQLIARYRELSGDMESTDDFIWKRCWSYFERNEERYNAIGYVSKAAIGEGAVYPEGTHLAWLETDNGADVFVTALFTVNETAMTLRYIWSDPITEFEATARRQKPGGKSAITLIETILESFPSVVYVFFNPSTHLYNVIKSHWRVGTPSNRILEHRPVQTDSDAVIYLN